MTEPLAETLRVEGGRVLATLIRLTGDLGLAEDALSEAVLLALDRWPANGVPDRPGAWLTTVARRKALDTLRRESHRSEKELAAIQRLDDDQPWPESAVRDDQLRLLFTCCHPALAFESRVALALRTVSGLTTAEIARAFLVSDATMGQRISRAKRKIVDAGIPYRIPPDSELPNRLRSVLAVIHVVFTTGHHAPTGPQLTRVDLAAEAIRLAGEVVRLMPDEPECVGLLALFESTHARRATRVDERGEVVLLRDADRSRWDQEAIRRASLSLETALRGRRPGPYQLQAAISCLHGLAPDAASTDWPQIVELYRILEQIQPTSVVRVNRAVAEAELHGPAAGLALLDSVDGVERWHTLHSARAELLRRLGRHDAAAVAYRRALACEPNEIEARFLREQLAATERSR